MSDPYFASHLRDRIDEMIANELAGLPAATDWPDFKRRIGAYHAYLAVKVTVDQLESDANK